MTSHQHQYPPFILAPEDKERRKAREGSSKHQSHHGGKARLPSFSTLYLRVENATAASHSTTAASRAFPTLYVPAPVLAPLFSDVLSLGQDNAKDAMVLLSLSSATGSVFTGSSADVEEAAQHLVETYCKEKQQKPESLGVEVDTTTFDLLSRGLPPPSPNTSSSSSSPLSSSLWCSYRARYDPAKEKCYFVSCRNSSERVWRLPFLEGVSCCYVKGGAAANDDEEEKEGHRSKREKKDKRTPSSSSKRRAESPSAAVVSSSTLPQTDGGKGEKETGDDKAMAVRPQLPTNTATATTTTPNRREGRQRSTSMAASPYSSAPPRRRNAPSANAMPQNANTSSTSSLLLCGHDDAYHDDDDGYSATNYAKSQAVARGNDADALSALLAKFDIVRDNDGGRVGDNNDRNKKESQTKNDDDDDIRKLLQELEGKGGAGGRGESTNTDEKAMMMITKMDGSGGESDFPVEAKGTAAAAAVLKVDANAEEDPTAMTANATEEELGQMSAAANVLQSKFRAFSLKKKKKETEVGKEEKVENCPNKAQQQIRLSIDDRFFIGRFVSECIDKGVTTVVAKVNTNTLNPITVQQKEQQEQQENPCDEKKLSQSIAAAAPIPPVHGTSPHMPPPTHLPLPPPSPPTVAPPSTSLLPPPPPPPPTPPQASMPTALPPLPSSSVRSESVNSASSQQQQQPMRPRSGSDVDMFIRNRRLSKQQQQQTAEGGTLPILSSSSNNSNSTTANGHHNPPTTTSASAPTFIPVSRTSSTSSSVASVRLEIIQKQLLQSDCRILVEAEERQRSILSTLESEQRRAEESGITSQVASLLRQMEEDALALAKEKEGEEQLKRQKEAGEAEERERQRLLEQQQRQHEAQQIAETSAKNAVANTGGGRGSVNAEDPAGITANATEEELQEMAAAVNILQSKFRAFNMRKKKKAAENKSTTAIAAPVKNIQEDLRIASKETEAQIQPPTVTDTPALEKDAQTSSRRPNNSNPSTGAATTMADTDINGNGDGDDDEAPFEVIGGASGEWQEATVAVAEEVFEVVGRAKHEGGDALLIDDNQTRAAAEAEALQQEERAMLSEEEAMRREDITAEANTATARISSLKFQDKDDIITRAHVLSEKAKVREIAEEKVRRTEEALIGKEERRRVLLMAEAEEVFKTTILEAAEGETKDIADRLAAAERERDLGMIKALVNKEALQLHQDRALLEDDEAYERAAIELDDDADRRDLGDMFDEVKGQIAERDAAARIEREEQERLKFEEERAEREATLIQQRIFLDTLEASQRAQLASTVVEHFDEILDLERKDRAVIEVEACEKALVLKEQEEAAAKKREEAEAALKLAAAHLFAEETPLRDAVIAKEGQVFEGLRLACDESHQSVWLLNAEQQRLLREAEEAEKTAAAAAIAAMMAAEAAGRIAMEEELTAVFAEIKAVEREEREAAHLRELEKQLRRQEEEEAALLVRLHQDRALLEDDEAYDRAAIELDDDADRRDLGDMFDEVKGLIAERDAAARIEREEKARLKFEEEERMKASHQQSGQQEEEKEMGVEEEVFEVVDGGGRNSPTNTSSLPLVVDDDDDIDVHNVGSQQITAVGTPDDDNHAAEEETEARREREEQQRKGNEREVMAFVSEEADERELLASVETTEFRRSILLAFSTELTDVIRVMALKASVLQLSVKESTDAAAATTKNSIADNNGVQREVGDHSATTFDYADDHSAAHAVATADAAVNTSRSSFVADPPRPYEAAAQQHNTSNNGAMMMAADGTHVALVATDGADKNALTTMPRQKPAPTSSTPSARKKTAPPPASSPLLLLFPKSTDITWSRTKRMMVSNDVPTIIAAMLRMHSASSPALSQQYGNGIITTSRHHHPRQVIISTARSVEVPLDSHHSPQQHRYAAVVPSLSPSSPIYQFPFAIGSLGLSRGRIHFEIKLSFTSHNNINPLAAARRHAGDQPASPPPFVAPLAYVGVCSKHFNGRSDFGASSTSSAHPSSCFLLRTTDGALVTSLDNAAIGVPYATDLSYATPIRRRNQNNNADNSNNNRSSTSSLNNNNKPCYVNARNMYIREEGDGGAEEEEEMENNKEMRQGAAAQTRATASLSSSSSTPPPAAVIVCTIGVIVDLAPANPHMRFIINGHDCGEAFAFTNVPPSSPTSMSPQKHRVSPSISPFEPLFPCVVFTEKGDCATFQAPSTNMADLAAAMLLGKGTKSSAEEGKRGADDDDANDNEKKPLLSPSGAANDETTPHKREEDGGVFADNTPQYYYSSSPPRKALLPRYNLKEEEKEDPPRHSSDAQRVGVSSDNNKNQKRSPLSNAGHHNYRYQQPQTQQPRLPPAAAVIASNSMRNVGGGRGGSGDRRVNLEEIFDDGDINPYSNYSRGNNYTNYYATRNDTSARSAADRVRSSYHYN